MLRAPRSQAWARAKMDLNGSDDEEEKAPPHENALEALLSQGAHFDLRGNVLIHVREPPQPSYMYEHMYENALEALLSEGVHFDLRGNVSHNVTYAQFQKLPASVQSSLAEFLPKDDRDPEMFEQALHNPQFAEAVREMEESLEPYTPRARQVLEDENWRQGK